MSEFVGVLVLVGIYLALCFGVAKAAKVRGRSWSSYFWLSFFLSPLTGYPILLIHGTEKETAAREKGELRRCPTCAEWIQAAASKCRFCGETLKPLAMTSEKSSTSTLGLS